MHPRGVLLTTLPHLGDVDEKDFDGRWHNVMPGDAQVKMVEGASLDVLQRDQIRIYSANWTLLLSTPREAPLGDRTSIQEEGWTPAFEAGHGFLVFPIDEYHGFL